MSVWNQSDSDPLADIEELLARCGGKLDRDKSSVRRSIFDVPDLVELPPPNSLGAMHFRLAFELPPPPRFICGLVIPDIEDEERLRKARRARRRRDKRKKKRHARAHAKARRRGRG